MATGAKGARSRTSGSPERLNSRHLHHLSRNAVTVEKPSARDGEEVAAPTAATAKPRRVAAREIVARGASHDAQERPAGFEPCSTRRRTGPDAPARTNRRSNSAWLPIFHPLEHERVTNAGKVADIRTARGNAAKHAKVPRRATGGQRSPGAAHREVAPQRSPADRTTRRSRHRDTPAAAR